MNRKASILFALLAGFAWPVNYHAVHPAFGQQITSTANLGLATKETMLSEDELREFLKTAKVFSIERTAKGITAPAELILSDGQRTIAASFQCVEIFRPRTQHPGYVTLEFRDSYEYDIAAYQLAKLLGLGNMMPVTVEYTWNRKQGALSLWVPAKWDEEDRHKLNLQPPDEKAWNKQLNRMWVFSQLVNDPDRNETNILVTEDWKLWMIDFSRAFRLETDPKNSQHLVMCDRQLMQKLRQLDEAQVLETTKPHLTEKEVKAVIARRDWIVAYFQRLIAEKGEEKVLY
jgi:hypothetical protein